MVRSIVYFMLIIMVSTQTLYEDAVRLNEYSKNMVDNSDKIRKLLKKNYGISSISANYQNKFLDYFAIAYLKNIRKTFSTSQINAMLENTQNYTNEEEPYDPPETKAFSNLSSVSWQTKLIDGTAQFLAKRFQEEINVAFLDRFREAIKDSNSIFPQLFPNTVELLLTGNYFNYGTMLPILKGSFKRDLSDLIYKQDKLILYFLKDYQKKSGKYINNLQGHTEIIKHIETIKSELANLIDMNGFSWVHKNKILSSIDTIHILVEDIHTNLRENKLRKELNRLQKTLNGVKSFLKSEIINYLTVSIDLYKKIKNEHNPAKILTELLESESIKRLMSEKLYQRLLILKEFVLAFRKNEKGDWLKLPDIDINKTETDTITRIYYGLLLEKFKNIKLGEKNLKEIVIESRNDVEGIITNFKKHLSEFQRIHMFFERLVKFVDKSKNKELTLNDHFEYVAKMIKVLMETYNIKTENNLIDKSLLSSVERYYQVILSSFKAVEEKNYALVLGNTYSLLRRSFGDNFQTSERFFKYASFMVAVTEAKTADDISAAISAAALPAGSYAIKRKTAFNISLNSYVGLSYGKLKPYIKNSESEWVAGFTAPIGLSLNFGKFGSDIGGASLFFSLVDLGEIVNLRLHNKTDSIPDMDLSNVLAPGVFALIHLNNYPVSLGASYSYIPQLQGIKDENGKILPQFTESKSYTRFAIHLVVDIPILNFYTSSD